MPTLGEIQKGYDIGFKGHEKYVWVACGVCLKERWVRLKKGEPQSKHCQHCNKENKGKYAQECSNWRGGRIKTYAGYIAIFVKDDDFFAPMKNTSNYVFEHRLVMAKHLGRNLHHWELVHHKNHIKDDNRIVNLQLVSDTRHTQITILEGEISRLKQRVTLLEADNVLLRTELKNASNPSQ